MRPGKFKIDTFGVVVFDAFTQGETWNGWARPYFTFEQAQRVVESHRSKGSKAWYDKAQDTFAFEFSPDEVDVFTAESVAGQKLYPIGAGCWIWEEATDEMLQ